MLKKIPWKNIIIVFTALLVVPVMAFAMTTKENPTNNNDNIKITSDEQTPDSVSSATSLLASGALGYIEGATSATTTTPGSDNTNPDAVSSATTNLESGSNVTGGDDQYESDDEAYESDDD